MRITSATTPQDLQKPLQQALQAWHKNTPEYLLDFLLVVRAQQMRAQQAINAPPDKEHLTLGDLRLATNQVLLAALEALETQDALSAQVLRARFLSRKSILQTAYTLNISEDQTKKRQQLGLAILAEIVFAWESQERIRQTQALEAQLPPPTYTHLFGLDQVRESLTTLLLSAEPPWMIALVGLGGIGKTALAQALTRAVALDFGRARVFWLYAPSLPFTGQLVDPETTFQDLIHQLADQLGLPPSPPATRLAQVRYRLKQHAHLILVDNLEAEAETVFFLEKMMGLANPSKFLLTTRGLPPGQVGVHTHRMAELSFADASALMRDHATLMGLGTLAVTEAADLQAIYTRTGGNPLALKLVVGLTAVLPLPVILEGMTRNHPAEIEAMYQHIYWKAWDTLSEDAQTLLLAMPLAGATGTHAEHLQAIGKLDPARFWPALTALVNRSLVEGQGSANERRYSLHPLTRTFLQTELLGRPDLSG